MHLCKTSSVLRLHKYRSSQSVCYIKINEFYINLGPNRFFYEIFLRNIFIVGIIMTNLQIVETAKKLSFKKITN